MRKLIALCLCLVTTAYAQKFEGLALTPPMGFNTWNTFASNIDEFMIKEAAEAMIKNGMRDAGYNYIVLDETWSAMVRDAKGNLQAHPDKFPSGMKALGDYLHERGFKFGNSKPWEWAKDVGHLWRTTGDITDCYDCVQRWERGWKIILDLEYSQVQPADGQNNGIGKYVGPGHWNDPDMLEVGNEGLTLAGSRAHFSLWGILAAPLMAGNDVRKMTAAITALLTHKEAIAINQDKLGQQGWRFRAEPGREVWVRELAGGEWAVVLLNSGNTATELEIDFSHGWWFVGGDCSVRDIWDKKFDFDQQKNARPAGRAFRLKRVGGSVGRLGVLGDEAADGLGAFGGVALFLDLVGGADLVMALHLPADLAEGEIFQLADALAGDLEFLADFLKGQLLLAVQAEAQLDDAGFAGVEGVDHGAEVGPEIFVAESLEGTDSCFVADQVAERGGVVVLADGGVERGGADADGLEQGDLGGRDLQLRGDFLVLGLAAEFVRELGNHLPHAGDLVHEVNGEADGLGLVGQGALHRLLDPPRGVGGELAALGGVEALDGLDQAEVAFADQVHEREAHLVIIVGDFHDQAQVGLDHVIAGGLVSTLDAGCELDLFLHGQQRSLTDLVEVKLEVGALVAPVHR